MKLPALPILEVLPELAAALMQRASVVLTAPPGSGKTTLVPLALRDAAWLAGRRILMLEPRRLAARAAAKRMAELCGERVGEGVGYQVRFERRIGPHTRIEVLTEGLLTRRLQAAPDLPGVGLVIFDEFHERSLEADLALALALDARTALELDFRILVMSATLDAQRVAGLLDAAPIIRSDGRLYPVDIRYRPVRAPSPEEAVAAGVRAALSEIEGGILAFLPGGREIRAVQRALDGCGARVYPLYGALAPAEQDAALYAPAEGTRKIVLATNLAQTSLTVEGIAAVVDGGQVRVPHYDVATGANRLVTEPVSRASADQRSGRAGRLGPGVAYRLWSQERQGYLPAQDTPEVLGADLSRLALELAVWGARDPATLHWLDPPPSVAWAAAQSLLRQLNAVDATGRVTTRGRELEKLPLEPRRGAMLLAARERGLAGEAVWLAALLDERGGLRGGSDVATCLARLQRHTSAIPRRMIDGARQLFRLVDVEFVTLSRVTLDNMGRVLALGYPERIARRRGQAHGVFLCADGVESRIDTRDDLAAAAWLAVAHWQPGPTRRIGLAARLDDATLRADHAHRFTREDCVRWDVAVDGVVAERVTRFGAIEVARAPWLQAPVERVQEVFIEHLQSLGARALPWTEELRQWQARVSSLRAWYPQEEWPDVCDDALFANLGAWLSPVLRGVTRLAQLPRLDLQAALAHQITAYQRAQLARRAPTHLSVPSGSSVRVAYATDGGPPHLAVKLQELFGLAQTPTVDEGRMPVVLELLSPARRPVQTTRDLASFWRNGYAEVRRELRGRYPKHPWPADPLTALPSARARRRP
ncbi:MAG TPA: ATP-dependent helicase HrpB [Nevskiaceae bacterium]|nr:ATP-dependent helicase HrpB [Nevskiaceae bacterium]